MPLHSTGDGVAALMYNPTLQMGGHGAVVPLWVTALRDLCDCIQCVCVRPPHQCSRDSYLATRPPEWRLSCAPPRDSGNRQERRGPHLPGTCVRAQRAPV
jgi:hypothetical protein